MAAQGWAPSRPSTEWVPRTVESALADWLGVSVCRAEELESALPGLRGSEGGVKAPLVEGPGALCVDSRNCTEMLCLPETSLIKVYPSSIPLPQGLLERLGILSKPFQVSKGHSLALDLVPAASVF